MARSPTRARPSSSATRRRRLLKAADAAKARGHTIINAGATDDRLREEDCRANVMHVAPTRSMLADGLAQYLVWKKWRKWLLLTGSHDKDKLFAAALRHSAARFGAKIVEEREFKDTGGARRTDSGIVEIQRQMPVLTQSAPDYDVLVAADESEVFAGYLPYRTWDARPVAGSAGLVPDDLGSGVRSMGRHSIAEPVRQGVPSFMSPLDMQAWSAVRMVGEAATRANSATRQAARLYKEPGFLARRLQGPEAHFARLEPATAPADPAVRRPQHRFRFPAGGLSASDFRVGYARGGSAGNQMQAEMTTPGVAVFPGLQVRVNPPGVSDGRGDLFLAFRFSGVGHASCGERFTRSIWLPTVRMCLGMPRPSPWRWPDMRFHPWT